MSKPDGWTTRVNAGEVVVGVGYSDRFVLLAVKVGMTDKGCLAMLIDR